jgi:hypothetical protein
VRRLSPQKSKRHGDLQRLAAFGSKQPCRAFQVNPVVVPVFDPEKILWRCRSLSMSNNRSILLGERSILNDVFDTLSILFNNSATNNSRH